MMYKYLVFAFVLLTAVSVNGSDGPDTQYGLQSIGKVIKQFIRSQKQDLTLADGIHIISTADENDVTGRATDDTSLLGVLENYLKTHELRIKLDELMPNGYDVGRALREASGSNNGDIETGRGKNKGGSGGALLLLGSLFASTLGAIGIGGVGLLAMKALTVASMALLLAAVIGIKKLASSHDDSGGHHVIHAGHDHRKKREATNLAYRAWSPYSLS